MVISRCRFAENGKEIYRNKKNHVKGVQSFCFCLLNEKHFWHRRCRADESEESNKQYNLGKNFQIMSLRAFVDSIIILHYLVLRK